MDIIQSIENLEEELRLALQCMNRETQKGTIDHKRDYCSNILTFTNGTPADS